MMCTPRLLNHLDEDELFGQSELVRNVAVYAKAAHETWSDPPSPLVTVGLMIVAAIEAHRLTVRETAEDNKSAMKELAESVDAVGDTILRCA